MGAESFHSGTDRETRHKKKDMKKLTVDFRNFSTAPVNKYFTETISENTDSEFDYENDSSR